MENLQWFQVLYNGTDLWIEAKDRYEAREIFDNNIPYRGDLRIVPRSYAEYQDIAQRIWMPTHTSDAEKFRKLYEESK